MYNYSMWCSAGNHSDCDGYTLSGEDCECYKCHLEEREDEDELEIEDEEELEEEE